MMFRPILLAILLSTAAATSLLAEPVCDRLSEDHLPTETNRPEPKPLTRFELSGVEMAVPIKFVLYAADREAASNAVSAAFTRIGQLNSILSDYDPQSELRRLDAVAREFSAQSDGKRAIPVSIPVSAELWTVLLEADETARLSQGAFDVTIGPVVRLWRRARRQHRLPDSARLEEARSRVGYQYVQLGPKDRHVTLLKKGMRLDLGGIAKGFAIDEALRVLRQHGITRALVDAGGDIGLGDSPPGKDGWRIAIERLDGQGRPEVIVSLKNCAIATSGDTWQYVEIDGRRYSHLVDPRTGVGLTDHSSVTVIADRAMTADALASAVSVLGPQRGIELIDATPQAAARVVRCPEGKAEVVRSFRWKKLVEKQAAR